MQVNFQRVFDKIDELSDKYLGVWEDICDIESPTSFKEGVDAVGKYLSDMAQSRGWSVCANSQQKAGNVVCITVNPNADKKCVVLSGHMDTVHPIGLFGTPAVKIENGKIYGPGVMDCKGGIVGAFLAMDALFQCGYSDRPIKLLLQADEECSSTLSNKENINYICRQAMNAECFLNCEGYSRGTLVLERKGILKYKFMVYGKSIHASGCTEGASAIAQAAMMILELEKMKDKNGLTCNCGIIKGGSAPNTVPDYCEFTVDIRFATEEQLEQVRAKVKDISENISIDGCACEIVETGLRPAMVYSEKNEALLEKINKAFSMCGLPNVSRRVCAGGSDAAEVTQAGIPCVDSIGVEGNFIHTQNEFAYISSLNETAKRLAAVIMTI